MKNLTAILFITILTGCNSFLSTDKAEWKYLDKDTEGKYNYSATQAQTPVLQAGQQIGQQMAQQAIGNYATQALGTYGTTAAAVLPSLINGGSMVQAGQQLGTQALARALPQGVTQAQVISQLGGQVLGFAQQGLPMQQILSQAMGYTSLGLNSQQILGTTLGVLTNPQSGLSAATGQMAKQSICAMGSFQGCGPTNIVGQLAAPVMQQAIGSQTTSAVQNGLGLVNAFSGMTR